MKDIIKLIKSMPDYIGANGVDEKTINDAEKVLGLKFAKEYREYLANIGLAGFDDRELTGICKQNYLNVVYETNRRRKLYFNVPKDMYVVENLNIDGIVIWQSSDGSIYQTVHDSKPEKIYDSLYDYILED